MIEVKIPSIPKDEAGILSRDVKKSGLLELQAQRHVRGEEGSRFFLSQPGQGCACSFLADNADWNAPYYQLADGVEDLLERTVRYLAQRAGPAGFSIEAAWLEGAWTSRSSAMPRPVQLESLLAELRQRRIGNKLLYQVAGHAA